jgi:hypothetical protein
MKTIQQTIAILFVAIMSSCASSEIGDIKDVNPETVYSQYELYYEEGYDSVSIQAQFRFGGNKGTTLVLTNQSSVTLDAEQLPVDSAENLGAYYRVNKAANGFAGNHDLVFTGFNGKKYRNSFAFEPFAWGANTETMSKKGAMILLDGLKNGTEVAVEISDTAAATNDLDKKYSIAYGKISLPSADLATLANGPISVSVYRTVTKKLAQTTAEGGVLEINYALKKRTLQLVD